MSNSTNNKIIHINMYSALENNATQVFQAMQEAGYKSINIENCNAELQKSYMRLMSGKNKTK